MDVKTRSDYHKSLFAGCHRFSTVAEAYSAWQQDPHIWKLSWTDAEGTYRYRPKMRHEKWAPLSEKILEGMSPVYQQAPDDELFWVDQKICPDDIEHYISFRRKMPEEEWDDLYMSNCIAGVLSDSEFRKKYC